MTTTTVERPKSRETLANLAAGDRFAEDTKDHRLTILHDQDGYKHLLFKTPGASFYWYELIVWPGCLTISGDMGTWTFRRDTDMLRFFRSNPDRALGHDYRINASYWAEKLQGGLNGGRADAQQYDPEALADHFATLARERAEDAGMREEDVKAVLEHLATELTDLFGADGDSESERIDLEAARAFEHTQDFVHRDDEPDEDPERFVLTFDWDDCYDAGPFRKYDNRFLWCLHAIVTGIEQYDAAKAAEKDPEEAMIEADAAGIDLTGE